MGARIMIREDAEVSELAKASLEADGVQVLTGHKALRCELRPVTASASSVNENPSTVTASASTVTASAAKQSMDRHASLAMTNEGVAMTNEGVATTFEKCLIVEHNGQEQVIPFDQLLCAVGRVARLQGYGLEGLGIPTHRTVETNEYLQTIYPNIYAAGDVAGPFQFTHTAAHQAWYAAVNALFGEWKLFKADYSVIPWATFIDPEVARVGLNEQEAKEKNIPYEVTKYGIDDLDRAIADSEAHGFVKVLTVPGKDKILGVTIVGAHAADLLAEFVLAMKHGLGLNKILGTIHTYPTMSEANKYAAGEWKRAHAPQRLLAWVKKYHDYKRGA
jgi:pyruvate/2-oxoglutarate dehydrogenase complex dihydrolipoamide dehydrogenase (E3) component